MPWKSKHMSVSAGRMPARVVHQLAMWVINKYLQIHLETVAVLLSGLKLLLILQLRLCNWTLRHWTQNKNSYACMWVFMKQDTANYKFIKQQHRGTF